MIQTRFRPAIGTACLALVLIVPAAEAAQTRAQVPQPPIEAPRLGLSDTQLDQNANETRKLFYRVLDQYPPGLGRVLRLDPTLMTNQAYLASYPKVAAVLAQYPDIPRNPGFYLDRYDPNFVINEPPDSR